MKNLLRPLAGQFVAMYKWLDNDAGQPSEKDRAFDPEAKKVNLIRLTPFWMMHLACVAVFWVGFSWTAFDAAVAMYAVRMFAITGWYHRYFSHRTFKTSRAVQFIFACIGNASAQRGALHWAAHHRHHHRFSDQPEDPHSPRQYGFWISHMLWFSKSENSRAKSRELKDFCGYPELLWIDRFDFVVPAILGFSLLALGSLLRAWVPSLHTNGWQMLIWGFFISTVALYHGTFAINSLGHILGRSRYVTGDDSKNSALLAVFTLGEGWHNNHHHYANSVRQGFRWWEFDVSFYVLWAMSKMGLVWDMKPVPERLLHPEKRRTLKQRPAEPNPLAWERHRRQRAVLARAGLMGRAPVLGRAPV